MTSVIRLGRQGRLALHFLTDDCACRVGGSLCVESVELLRQQLSVVAELDRHADAILDVDQRVQPVRRHVHQVTGFLGTLKQSVLHRGIPALVKLKKCAHACISLIQTYILRSFVRSFVRSLARSFVRFARSFVRSCVCVICVTQATVKQHTPIHHDHDQTTTCLPHARYPLRAPTQSNKTTPRLPFSQPLAHGVPHRSIRLVGWKQKPPSVCECVA